jgi:hypothetical protein
MRWVSWLCLALSFVAGPVLAQQSPPLVALDSVVALVAKGESVGHGTVVAPNTILTVAHVARYGTLTWRDDKGHQGYIDHYQVDPKSDTAILTSRNQFGAFAPRATRQLVPGETVWFRFYVDNDLSRWNYGHYVGRDKRGRLLIDGMAWPGSSGSGVITADGEWAGAIQAGTRPGYCPALLMNLNVQTLVDCLLTVTLSRGAVAAVPSEAFR